MAHILIFANPIAGRGSGKAIALLLAKRLKRDGHDAEVMLDPPEEISQGADHIIAIGGDGTIRGVAQRVAESGGKKPAPMLIVPMGTANLLGRHLGIRWNREKIGDEVARTLAKHRLMKLDAARANDELFLLMAGIGLDAQVVHELGRIRRGPIDYLSYIMPAATALAQYRFPAITVVVDGKTVAREVPAVAFAGNVKEYGTGFPILPHARPDDGLLDVCVLPCANPKDLVFHLMRAAAGEHLAAEGSIYVKGKHVRIDSDVPVPVQLDGDAAGHTPLKIDLMPNRLAFMVPA